MFKDFLIEIGACHEAIEFAEGKTWEEFYKTCQKGRLLLGIFVKTNPKNKRLRVLVEGRIADSVSHYLIDRRKSSISTELFAYGEDFLTVEDAALSAHVLNVKLAIAAAIQYGNKKIGDDSLKQFRESALNAARFLGLKAKMSSICEDKAMAWAALAATDEAFEEKFISAASMAAYEYGYEERKAHEMEAADILRRCIAIKAFKIKM